MAHPVDDDPWPMLWRKPAIRHTGYKDVWGAVCVSAKHGVVLCADVALSKLLLRDGKLLCRTPILFKQDPYPTSMCLTPDEEHVLVVKGTRYVRRFRIGCHEFGMEGPHMFCNGALYISIDCNTEVVALAYRHPSAGVCIFSAHTQVLLHLFPVRPNISGAYGTPRLRILRDNTGVVVTSPTNSLVMYDYYRGDLLGEIPIPNVNPVHMLQSDLWDTSFLVANHQNRWDLSFLVTGHLSGPLLCSVTPLAAKKMECYRTGTEAFHVGALVGLPDGGVVVYDVYNSAPHVLSVYFGVALRHMWLWVCIVL